MDRREFLRNSAALAAATAVPGISRAAELASKASTEQDKSEEKKDGPLITSAPFLENYAEDSIGIAFAVSDMANGYVILSENKDMSGSRTIKCGGYRVTDMNPDVMLVRITGLKSATKYYYRIGADRIHYGSGYDMKIIGNEEDPRIYSFTTAGAKAKAHFCVINDTHTNFKTFEKLTAKLGEMSPSCVIWNGDATNHSEDIDVLKTAFLQPPVTRKDYASETPFLFTPGNHDSRGMASRHIEEVWMFRQPEERSSRDWDLGRNYAVRMGDIAMIGLDTAEDKVDENPLFAGLFNSGAYREAQVAWLEDALKREEIASAPFLVAFCHIPLYDPRPDANPGDIHPADKDPRYKHDYASWQRTCANLWTPLLSKAGCQLIITAHQHCYRYNAPDAERSWAQIVGGGPEFSSDDKGHFPSIIEGKVKGNKLNVTVYNAFTDKIVGKFDFKAR